MVAGVVAVESLRAPDGSLVIATARAGIADASRTTPFAFEPDADGRFVACLYDRAPGRAFARVLIDAAQLHVEWSGALEVLVVREREVLHRTTPHLAAPEIAGVRHGLLASGPRVDVAGPWSIAPRDLVLLCSTSLRSVLSDADITTLASRDDVAAVVRGLVTTAGTRTQLPELAAIAIQISRPGR